jgi:hypothetical protein
MSIPANETARASHASHVAPVQEGSFLSRPGGRIGYGVAGNGSLVVLCFLESANGRAFGPDSATPAGPRP